MNQKKMETVKAAIKVCGCTDGYCPADCPGRAMCFEEGKDILAEAAEMVEAQELAVRVLADALAGADRVYLYFATRVPIDAAALPEDGYIAHVNHDERKYIRLIDDMAYGTAIYRRRLEPWEIAKTRLTSAPRD